MDKGPETGWSEKYCEPISGVAVTWYTDPACPSSWAAEPVRLSLAATFGDSVTFTYVMNGSHRDVHPGPGAARAWLDVGAAAGMPVDARPWLDGPPFSSHPVSMAVRAAGEQGLAGAYLRRARLALALGRGRLEGREALGALAREVGGLDGARFDVDLASHAIVEALGDDLELARAAGCDQRPWAQVGAGAPIALPGAPEVLAEAVRAQGATAVAPPDPLAAVGAWGPLSTAEVAAVCGLAGPLAPARLWQAASEWRLRVDRVGGGELWRAA